MLLCSPSRGNFFMLMLLVVQFVMTIVISIAVAFSGVTIESTNVFFLVGAEVVSFLLPVGVYLLVTKQSAIQVLSLRPISVNNLILIFFIIVLLQPLIMFVASVSNLVFPDVTSEAIGAIPKAHSLLVSLGAIAVTPAICEEVAFRGVILHEYHKVPVRTAALLNGFLFGVVHLNGLQFSYAFLCGFVFVYLVYYTKSIFASMFAHFIVNGGQTMMIYISTKFYPEALEKTAATMGEKLDAVKTTFVLAVVALPFFILLFKRFIKNNKENLVEIAPIEAQHEEAQYEQQVLADCLQEPEEPKAEQPPRIMTLSLVFVIIIFVLALAFNQLLAFILPILKSFKG